MRVEIFSEGKISDLKYWINEWLKTSNMSPNRIVDIKYSEMYSDMKDNCSLTCLIFYKEKEDEK